MGGEVFANGNEVACKSGDGKVIAAFPDVCLSPPSPPAGPIPIPYPNTSFSKDMKNGTKTVKIKKKEVMQKNKSFYKTSPLGDEAATKGLGAGVITHVITGKTYFKMWSMDVKYEGLNVCRHIDITTSNHMSDPPNEGVPMPNAEDGAQGDTKNSPTEGKDVDKQAPCFSSGDHPSIVCNAAACPECWGKDTPCVENAKALNDEYAETQAGESEEEIVQAGHRDLDDRASRGLEPRGLAAERATLDEFANSADHTVEKVGYKAHCTVCHVTMDLDLVTDKYVIEIKAGKVKENQFRRQIAPAAKKCFPGKQLAVRIHGQDPAKIQSRTLDKWSNVTGVKAV